MTHSEVHKCWRGGGGAGGHLQTSPHVRGHSGAHSCRVSSPESPWPGVCGVRCVTKSVSECSGTDSPPLAETGAIRRALENAEEPSKPRQKLHVICSSNFKLKCTGCGGGTGPEAADMKLVPAAQLAAEGLRPRSGLYSMPASQWRHRERGSDPHSVHVWSVCRYLCLLRQVPRSLLCWQA